MPDETERVEFNIDSVTVAEAELLEETLGIPWIECIGVKSGMAKVMRGFVWLHKRRTDPDLKFEDVTFLINSFAQELGAEEDPGPLPEASEPSATTSKSSSTRSTESAPGNSDSSPSSNSKDAVPVSNP